jgi:hypothetical protein
VAEMQQLVVRRAGGRLRRMHGRVGRQHHEPSRSGRAVLR